MIRWPGGVGLIMMLLYNTFQAPGARRGPIRCAAWLIGVAAMAGSLAGCGPEPSEETWTYGGANRPVLSWPVLDGAGNAFVIVGSEAVPIAPGWGGYSVQGVELVSLDPSGRFRWSVPVLGPSWVGGDETRPSVHEGDVWVYLRDRIFRISANGQIRWTLEDVPSVEGPGWPLDWTDSSRTALDSAGNFYFMPFVTESRGVYRQELWSISDDGHIRWRIAPNLSGGAGHEESWPPPSQTQAPLVLPDDVVVVGCSTCVAGRAGLAEIDPRTGVASLLYSVDLGAHRLVTSGDLRWDGLSVWYEFAIQLTEHWSIMLDSSGTRQSYALALMTSSGAVWIEDEQDEQGNFVLHWGDVVVRVNVDEVVRDSSLRTSVRALAATEPAAVLIQVNNNEDYYLALVDLEGEILWHRAGIAHSRDPAPVIGGGRILYIEDGSRRLVSERLPVTGLASGPWPIVAGTVQNTRRGQPGP